MSKDTVNNSEVYAHFIGVGGAGMSGIARVLFERGIGVTGSDLRESRYSRQLQEIGLPVTIGHDRKNLGDPQVVVTSTAIPETNPELKLAREKGLEIWPRAKMLSTLGENKKTVAVAGTHGKTSASSMFATMLEKMGEDPTFLIGGEIDTYKTNAADGKGEHFVIEADESDGSFIYLDPYIALITNVEADHLDHYDSLDEIHEIFGRFIASTPDEGAVVVWGDDEALVRIAKEHAGDTRIITYGMSDECDIVCKVTGQEGISYLAQATLPDGLTLNYKVNVPGEHMVLNATGVLAGGWALGLDMEKAAKALSEFVGVRRRFDYVGSAQGVTIVDDYGHHPTEVAATLKAASTLGFERIHVLFQPHRYSRTQIFSREFGRSFKCADTVTFMDVYSAGESPIPGVSGKTLVNATLRENPRAIVGWMPHRKEIVDFLATKVRPGDLVLTMGAGDVTAMGPSLLEKLESLEKESEGLSA